MKSVPEKAEREWNLAAMAGKHFRGAGSNRTAGALRLPNEFGDE